MPFDFKEVRRRRIVLGKTQDEMAFKSGMESKVSWGRYELGRVKNPKLDSLESIALALGCELMDLVTKKAPSKRRAGADGVRR